jgi:hypothetical protein
MRKKITLQNRNVLPPLCLADRATTHAIMAQAKYDATVSQPMKDGSPILGCQLPIK